MAERDDEMEAARDREEEIIVESAPKVEVTEIESLSPEDVENQMPSQQQEEEVMKKKYGGLVSKKPPLISKDNERAFFDSADWALGKKSKGPLEALRPKLQPTPQQQVRSRSLCAPAADGEDHDCNSDDSSLDINPAAEDHNLHA